MVVKIRVAVVQIRLVAARHHRLRIHKCRAKKRCHVGLLDRIFGKRCGKKRLRQRLCRSGLRCEIRVAVSKIRVVAVKIRVAVASPWRGGCSGS